jgi:hypothetical protein
LGTAPFPALAIALICLAVSSLFRRRQSVAAKRNLLFFFGGLLAFPALMGINAEATIFWPGPHDTIPPW